MGWTFHPHKEWVCSHCGLVVTGAYEPPVCVCAPPAHGGPAMQAALAAVGCRLVDCYRDVVRDATIVEHDGRLGRVQSVYTVMAQAFGTSGLAANTLADITRRSREVGAPVMLVQRVWDALRAGDRNAARLPVDIDWKCNPAMRWGRLTSVSDDQLVVRHPTLTYGIMWSPRDVVFADNPCRCDACWDTGVQCKTGTACRCGVTAPPPLFGSSDLYAMSDADFAVVWRIAHAKANG